MKIVNLTQHTAAPEQRAAGVFDLQGGALKEAKEALDVASLPSSHEIEARADTLARIARDSGADAAMIGGAPFIMVALHNALGTQGVTPCYAFSKRVSVEETLPDGSVRKSSMFKHEGFVFPAPHFKGCQYPDDKPTSVKDMSAGWDSVSTDVD